MKGEFIECLHLNKFLVNKRMIVKEGKGYRYNPDFHY